MKMKLLAMGNVLMGDDGIAVYMAGILEESLREMGIEVIYGETDIGYCLSRIQEGDYIILLDASDLGKEPGEITMLSFDNLKTNYQNMTHHSVSFLDLLRLYFPKNDGNVITVQVKDIHLCYGISKELKEKTANLSLALQKQILSIRDIIKKEEENTSQSTLPILAQIQQSTQEAARIISDQELAKYDGSDGKPAYVAVNNEVYDMTNVPVWAGGTHFGLLAGKNLTHDFSICHNGMEDILNNLPKVGVLQQSI